MAKIMEVGGAKKCGKGIFRGLALIALCWRLLRLHNRVNARLAQRASAGPPEKAPTYNVAKQD